MYQITSQESALKAALLKKGMDRETLAFALGVSVRAVHRWLVEGENPNHRAMPAQQLQEVLYWLAGAPGRVEFCLSRSLTGIKQLHAAERRAAWLADEAARWNTNEGEDPRADFARAKARLAWAKKAAIEMANPADGILKLRAGCPGLSIVGDEEGDPILLIRVSA